MSPFALAQELRQYRKDGRDFYEWKVRTNAFENAYRDYQQELLAEGIDENHPDYESRMNMWKERNTRVVIKQEYFDEKRRIIDEITQILSKLPKNEQAKLDQASIWEDILELTGGFRDTDGQIEGHELSEGSIAKIKSLQLKLEQIKEDVAGKSGLTPKELNDLSYYYDLAKSKTITPDQRARMVA